MDCVIGGSPCQDLSIAGKREGLAGARSGLFMEQIRIVKEMREADRLRGRTGQFVRPRYMVWENVPGAFSSNGGEDFRAVLEETIRIAEPDAPDVPLPPKGKWPLADAYYGDGWSVAYRVLDAQFWGVPQRRRRIALVADFGGQSAPEILFERKSVCGNQAAVTAEGEAPAAGAGRGADTASTRDRIAYSFDSFLNANENGGQSRDAVFCIQGNCIDRSDTAGCNGKGWKEDVSYTLNTIDRPAVFDARGNGNGETVPTITGDYENRVTDYTAVVMATGQANAEITVDKSPTLNCNHEAPIVAAVDCRNGVENAEVNGTLQAKSTGGSSLNLNNVVREARTVRRLTPLECERLQGFPSTKKLDVSKMTKDEYIAWNLSVGNIIADCEHGKVFATRGPGGIQLDKPKELKGTILNGYRVVSIRNGTTKLQCRVHRIIWISAHGVLPEGYCIDHINNDKQDNRLSNLQLLTPAENSAKAVEDGLYKTGEDNAATKLSPDLWDEIAYLYDFTDFTIRDLAEIYGVSKSRIHQIIKEVGWTDIGEWTDSKGKVHQTSDAARYKAMGNSIALPPWKWVLKRLCACYERDATMASLFDGVGGFPLIWERLNGPGTCLWASEIEPFCVAVTTRHFNKA